jgi:hypothetical protein
MYWKSCGRKKEEKKQYSQYPDQDSNLGPLKIQRRNAVIAVKFSGQIVTESINMMWNNCS